MVMVWPVGVMEGETMNAYIQGFSFYCAEISQMSVNQQ